MKELRGEIHNLPVADIKPYEGAHNTDEVVEMLKESLKQYGLQQPISVDKNYVVVTGNGVFKAARELGFTEIPCIILDDLTENEIAEYRIADNKTSEFAKWNEKKLRKELSYLDNAGELQYCFDEDLYRMLGLNPDAPTSSAPTTQVATPAPQSTPSVAPGGAVHTAPTTPTAPTSSTPGQSRPVDAEVTIVNRPTAEQAQNFREALKSTEKSMEVAPTEYFEYECSRCHKIVRVKAR